MAILQRLNRRDCLPSNSCSGAAMPSHLWASRSSITEPINDALAEKSSPGHNLLIVGISVVATVAVFLSIYVFCRMRQGLSFRQAFAAPKGPPQRQPSMHSSALPRRHSHWSVSPSMREHKPSFSMSQSDASCKLLPALPLPVIVRRSSEREFDSMEKRSGEYSPQIEMLPATPRDFLANEVTTRPACPPMSPSIAASSPILPLHSRRVTATTVSDADLGAETRSLRSAVRDRVPQHRESRSSWNDERSSTLTRSPRQSAETSRASGGFRTVDSWVNNQSSRAEERRLKERYRGEGVKEPVPELPEHFKRKTAALSRVPTVFRQHPGREVVFGRDSVSSRLSGHPTSGGAKDK